MLGFFRKIVFVLIILNIQGTIKVKGLENVPDVIIKSNTNPVNASVVKVDNGPTTWSGNQSNSLKQYWFRFSGIQNVTYVVEVRYPQLKYTDYSVFLSLLSQCNGETYESCVEETATIKYEGWRYNLKDGRALIFTAHTSGSIWIHVATFDEIDYFNLSVSTADIEDTIDDTPYSAVSLNADGSVFSGNISYYDREDWFKFHVIKGNSYFVHLKNYNYPKKGDVFYKSSRLDSDLHWGCGRTAETCDSYPVESPWADGRVRYSLPEESIWLFTATRTTLIWVEVTFDSVESRRNEPFYLQANTQDHKNGNTPENASLIQVNDTSPVSGTIIVHDNEEDWFQFQAVENLSYTINLNFEVQDVIIYMALYSACTNRTSCSDKATAVETDWGSMIVYDAVISQTLWIKISKESFFLPMVAPYSMFLLSSNITITPTFSPSIEPLTDAPTVHPTLNPVFNFSQSAGQKSPQNHNKGLSVGAIAGISIATVVFFGLLVLLTLRLITYSRSRNGTEATKQIPDMPAGMPSNDPDCNYTITTQ